MRQSIDTADVESVEKRNLKKTCIINTYKFARRLSFSMSDYYYQNCLRLKLFRYYDINNTSEIHTQG